MARPIPDMTHVGLDRRPIADAYHFLLQIGWPSLVGMVTGVFVLYNALFAVLYLLGGDCIDAEDPTSFLQAFSFSVQTMSSTGYGTMSPTTSYAHVVTIVESFGGLLGTALVTGLMFAKFARPTARIAYSDKAIITTYDGQPTLQFRLANQRRGSMVIDARIQVDVLIDELTVEGQSIRRLYRLKLLRSQSPAFRLTWVVIHTLDDESPVRSLAEGRIPDGFMGLLVNTVGMDDVFSQSVHAQVIYTEEDLLFDHQFTDMISGDVKGTLVVDHRRLHETEPVGYGPAEEDG